MFRTKDTPRGAAWNAEYFARFLTSDPHKKHFRCLGKHHGKTKGAFGKKRSFPTP